MQFDPASPSTLYAANPEFGVYRSRDGGETWRSLSHGIPDLTVSAIVPDPQRQVLYALADRVYRSDNKGLDWSRLNDPIAPGDHTLPQSVSSLTIDPTTGRLYGGAFGNGPFFGSVPLFRSNDSGNTWTPLSFCATSVRAASPQLLTLDPGNPQIIYGVHSVFNTRLQLCRSSDGGSTWEVLPTSADVKALAMDPNAPSNLYVIGGLFTSGGQKILRSRDAGKTWLDITGGVAADSDGPGISAIALDPVRSSNVYAIALRSGAYNVHKSLNAGQSWQLLARLATSTVNSLLVDPIVSSTLYVGTSDRGILRSEDGGLTWTEFNDGLEIFTVRTLAIESADGTLYAGTHGGSIYARMLYPEAERRNVIYADPNPVLICGTASRSVKIFWHAPGLQRVQIRIGSSSGPLFALGGERGEAQAGEWLRDGMQFHLIGSDGTTLASTTVRVGSPECPDPLGRNRRRP